MARHAPTEEQQLIIDASVEMVSSSTRSEGSIKALAAAGSGKTSTLIEIGRAVCHKYPRAKILYLAYNREIKAEASAKFGDLAESYTMHGLAHQELNIRSISRRLGNINKNHIRSIAGRHMSDSDIDLLQGAFRQFMQSSDIWPTHQHFPARIGGVTISQERKEKLMPALEEMIFALVPENRTGDFPLPHDLYLKYWQMIGSPGLERYDLVMLDEAQDANPVILSALEGAGRSLYVGDSHQAIYQWRDAVDALQKVYGHAYPMTQSFRFGPAIADLANEILSYKHDKPEHPLRGFERMDSIISAVDRKQQHARIYRTNRALIREALVLHDRSIPFAIAGNNDELCELIDSVWHLKNGNPRGVRHHSVRWLKSWEAALAEAEKGGDSKDLNQAINIVEDFGDRAPEVIHFLKSNNDESRARVILTTAHRSKGREWPNVVITPDFDPVIERAKASRNLWDAEMNLLYVAVTRAMMCLEVNCEWLKRLIEARRIHF